MVDSTVQQKIELERLLGLEGAGYFDDGWPQAPNVWSGDVARLPVDAALAQMDVRQLIVEHGGASRIAYLDAAGWQHMKPVPDRELVLGMFDRGNTVTLDGFHDTRYFDIDRGVQLLSELRLPAARRFLFATCFLSPPGQGVSKHFDIPPFFILQVRGRKRWQIAINHDAPHPTASWGPRWPQVAPRELAQRQAISTEMPDQAIEYELRPGDVLYVPPGFWHTASALDTSMAITLIPKIPSWKTLLLGYLRAAFDDMDDMRAPLQTRIDAAGRADEARRRLRELSRHWATGDRHELLERAVFCAMLPGLSANRLFARSHRWAGGETRIEEHGTGAEIHTDDTNIDISQEFVHLCRWLVKQDWFSLHDACRANPELAPSNVHSALRLLHDADVLETRIA